MIEKLPAKLKNDPLLEAVFECRFNALLPVSNMLPGIMFSEFSGEKKLERLAQSEIPEFIRNSDPNLMHAPLVRVTCGHYSYLIGDRSVAVSCPFPYRGWQEFRTIITQLIGLLKKSGMIGSISRLSAKYVDLIESTSPEDQVKLANLSLNIGGHQLAQESYQVKMELPSNGLVNIIQILSGATATLPAGASRQGVVIDIDTIKNFDNISFDVLEPKLHEHIDQIHGECKRIFFSCITADTLKKLEPEYD